MSRRVCFCARRASLPPPGSYLVKALPRSAPRSPCPWLVARACAGGGFALLGLRAAASTGGVGSSHGSAPAAERLRLRVSPPCEPQDRLRHRVYAHA
ncbi:hypothetical protein NDU88_005870 [Pleurodeles waltl]|uniref:Uncharacterized protein n=1 Tax=Pleurodeles waltl TaxID=8319 RepID=A0AAV7TW02_PLEWA|nr:hypothetical protein NDU88_005870 [Pleurodeles waltl]